MIRPSFGLGGVCTRPVRDRATGDPPASSNCTAGRLGRRRRVRGSRAAPPPTGPARESWPARARSGPRCWRGRAARRSSRCARIRSMPRVITCSNHTSVPSGSPSSRCTSSCPAAPPAPRIAAVAGVARHRHNRQRPQRIQRLRGAESRLGLLEVTEPLAGTAPQVLHHVRSFWG
jgi:hypothetical protein